MSNRRLVLLVLFVLAGTNAANAQRVKAVKEVDDILDRYEKKVWATQLGGCFPTIAHNDLTSINWGRFIRNNSMVALPTSVSPTMKVPLTDQSKCTSH